ncbi:DsbC family protein [Aurantivibrio plasticivorans]
MTKIKSITLMALGLIMIAGCADSVGNDSGSQISEAEVSVEEVIMQRLQAARPDFEFSDPKPAAIEGLYQVQVIGGPTLYVEKGGEFFIAGGDLFAIEGTRLVNLQEQQREKERVALLADIDPADQIIFSPEGETKAVVNVFTDIDCGYCQKLHREIEQINALGIEVRYLAYPRSGPNSESANKLAQAWCADDKQAALTKLKNRQNVDSEVCDNNPVAEQYRLGLMMGVTGTPNMITETGEMIGGYAPAAKLAEYLRLLPPSASAPAVN